VTDLLVPAADLLPGYSVDPETGAWLTLPWPDDPDQRQSLAASSIGPQVIDWAEGRTDEPGLIHPLTGEPWVFTRGQRRFLVLWYLVDADGRWVFRSGVRRGAKGTGKDPFCAAWLNAELVGPTLFSHFSDAGQPIGKPHRMPLVQVGANSQEQAKDVLRFANAMWSNIAELHYGLDTGETRTTCNDGGRLEVLTSSEASSEGDPASAIGLNESHHMTSSNGGHRTAETARRNVGKSPAFLQARALEFTNAHLQGSDSVAERSFEAWQKMMAAQTVRSDILYDSREAPPSTDWFDPDSRMAGLRAAYSDAKWADLHRLSGEVLDPRTSLADSIRYYGNGLAAAEDAWVDPAKFDALARPGEVVADGEQLAMFLDCSKSSDATALTGCRLSDGHVITLGMWQRPKGKRGDGWLVPRNLVDAEVRVAFDRYDVVWFGVDPSPAKDDETESLYWLPQIDAWHRDFRDKVKVWATPGAGGSAVLYDMRLSKPGGVKRNQEFTEAAMQCQKDIDDDQTLTWDGDPRTRLHVHQAKARPNAWGVTLGKVTRDSAKLVDLAVTMVGARLGRRLALNSGKLAAGKQRTGRAGFFGGAA
jgi:hypothetical protein